MKKVLWLMAVLSLAGCAGGFLKAAKPEEGQILAPLKEELRSDKVYRILEEKGSYYIVRLKKTGAAVPEKELPRATALDDKAGTLSQAQAPTPGFIGETQALAQAVPPDVKTETPTPVQSIPSAMSPGLEVAIPKGATPGVAAGSRQVRAFTEVMVGSRNLQTGEIDEVSKEIKVSTEGVKKDFRMTDRSLKKEVSSVLPSQPGQGGNRLKSPEDLSPRNALREVTVYFPRGRAIIPKGSPEHTRLALFAADLSREAKEKKVFLTLIGSASATGKSDFNRRLSQSRAGFVRKALDGLLENIPHDFFKVYGVGDSLSPKTEDGEINGKYQSVRIIAAYDIKDFPEIPGARN